MFERITQAKAPVLFWSGGLDSTLILALLRQENIPVDVVTFGRELWTKQQKKRADTLIREWDMKVFSYPPLLRSFIGDGENISAVFDYAVGDAVVPNIRNLIDGDRCIADIDGMTMYRSPVRWDCVILGLRADDKHWATKGLKREQEWVVGDTTFVCPLWDWNREEVQAALEAHGLPFTEVSDEEDTGNAQFCQKCLRAIEPVECPKDGTMINPMGRHLQLNLSEFRKRFSIL